MQKTDILCVGKLKEAYFNGAQAEYAKRLGAYTRLNIKELKDEPVPETAGEKLREQILEKEAERIEKELDERARLVILAIEGKSMDSVAFSHYIQKAMQESAGGLQFVIGGSLGIHERVKKRGDLLLSFSPMTLPHQLMRIVLLEQIYRAHRILAGAPYHK